MISPSTLAAFSPAVGPASQATRVAAPNTAAARASGAEPQQKPLQSLAPGATPARNTPRGSLLDLSV